MKTLLLISSRFPYPPIGGDKLKSHFLIQILKKHYKIHFVCISNTKITSEMIKYCEENFSSYKFFYKTRFDHLYAMGKKFFSYLPLQVSYYTFQDIKSYIKTHSINCDFIINTLVRTSEYALELKIPKFLDMVDSIAINYQHSQKKTKSIFWKLVYTLETPRLLRYEKKCVTNYNLSFFVNQNEATTYKKYGNVAWIPNGVDQKLFTYNHTDPTYSNCIVFCGKMDYQPNIDAILWFYNNVFHMLDSKIQLLVVGSNPSKKIQNLQSDRIVISGYVEDPYLLVNSAFLSIAPMQTGGGIQNKILEAMALGKIVITSELGASPIIGHKPSNLLVYKNAYHMARMINKIHDNPTRYRRIGKKAKRFISQNFTWEQYESKLITLLEQTFAHTPL